MTNLFSFQGKVYTATRNPTTGKLSAHAWLSNVSALTLDLTTDKSDKFESFSGNRALYGSLQKSRSAKISMTMDEFTPTSLALGLYASSASTVAGTVATGSAESLPAAMVAGDSCQLANRFVSALVIKDSAGSPATLVPGTDYVLTGAAAGIVTIKNVGSYTQPFKASYSYTANTNLVMFAQATPPEKALVLDGTNTNTGDLIVAELWRVQFDPVSGLALINDDWGNLAASGAVLYDSLNAGDATLGGFGRILINKGPTGF